MGTALGLLLTRDGHTVWGLRRHKGDLPASILPFEADLTSPPTLGDLPPELDFVFYTAAAGGTSDEAYRAAYVDGLRCLLNALAAQRQRPRRVFFTSSTGVYAQSEGEWVDETSPTEPEDFTGRRLLEGERLLLGGPFAATVLRLGGIYGPGRTRLIESVRRGEAVCAPDPPSYTNRIHRDDCAGALAHLMSLASKDEVYLGVDDEPAERCEVLRWLAARLGVPPPRVEPSSSAGPRSARGSKRCRNAKLRAAGYQFRYPTFREGYAAILAGDD